MADMQDILERQKRERRERMRRQAASKKAQRELDEQLGMAVALLEQENQSRRSSREGRASNVNRHRYSQGDYGNWKGQKSIILEAVAGFDTWVWHALFGVAGSQNDLNVLGQSPVFNDVLRGEGPNITYQINNTVYHNGYYLADGIYLRWTTFVKSIPHPRSHKEFFCAAYQEGYRKDVERCFGIFQARWAIIRDAARLFEEEVLRSIMMTCIILHNMIVEDEYDYDANEVYEPDPMNTALTRIYEKHMGPNGEPVQHDPLVRDGSFLPRMIERYTEMQSSYIHEHRQVDLMEHLGVVKGNEGE
ncbi:uncharacterized protein LOC109947306 [Prunus persica]|uniref:uncharacterized protein LOC109947306 n=1 Tax=Prunus persica TaxID=3760 RepID=UPI0009AB3ACA|nr:uncharacterized protein LOC109947306 [Prunus persica]